MNHVATIDRSKTTRTGPYWLTVLASICLLMVVTISSPDEVQANQYGTASILPPLMLRLLKLMGRVGVLSLLAYNLYLVWPQARRWKSGKVLLPMIGFVVFAVCSAAWSASITITLSQAATFGILIALSWLIATIWKDETDTSRILKCCSIMLFLISMGLIVLHFARPSLGVLTRDSAGLFHSTNAGASASLGIVILFACRMIWGWSWTRRLLIPATLVHLASMMIGANRLSLAMMLLLCFLVFAVLSNKGLVASAVLGAMLAGLVYLCLDPGLGLIQDLGEQVGVYTSQGQTQTQIRNLSGRDEMWQKIWDSYLESPLVGHGYFVTSATGRIYVWGEWGNWTAHNVTLQLLATTGIVGAFLLFAGIANILFRAFLKIGSADRGRHRLAVFVGLMTVWFLGWGLLNESFLGPLQPESVIFAITLGLATAIAISPDAQEIVAQPDSLSSNPGEQ